MSPSRAARVSPNIGGRQVAFIVGQSSTSSAPTEGRPRSYSTPSNVTTSTEASPQRRRRSMRSAGAARTGGRAVSKTVTDSGDHASIITLSSHQSEAKIPIGSAQRRRRGRERAESYYSTATRTSLRSVGSKPSPGSVRSTSPPLSPAAAVLRQMDTSPVGVGDASGVTKGLGVWRGMVTTQDEEEVPDVLASS